MKLSHPLDKTQITYLKEEGLEIIAASRAIVTEWDNADSPRVVAHVKLYDPSKNKYFPVTMAGEFLTPVHRLHVADRVTLIEPLNLMHDEVDMEDVYDSSGYDDPQWNPPGQESRGCVALSGTPVIVSFAVPSLNRSGQKI